MQTSSKSLRAFRTFLALSAAAAGLFGLATQAEAHVGIVNTQLPYAVAGKSYELVLAVPHGCTYEAAGAEAHADTYKVEVEVPAGFTGVRPIIDAAFGRPALTKDDKGEVTKLVWTKNPALDSGADDQSYRVGLRATAPNTPFAAVRFNVKQFCKNPAGGEDLVTDWANYGMPASNQSPRVKIYPARTPGWNKFSVPSSSEKHTPEAVAAFLTDYFSDAQIVWLTPGTNQGTGAWSANAETENRIKALAEKDDTTYEITEKKSVMIHAVDVIWAKF